MIKRTIKETITEYDKDGNIVRQTVTETQEDDGTQVIPYRPQFWYRDDVRPWWQHGSTYQCNATDKTE